MLKTDVVLIPFLSKSTEKTADGVRKLRIKPT